jgi:hypothetical protein
MQERERVKYFFLFFVNNDDDDGGNENRELENVAICAYRFAEGLLLMWRYCSSATNLVFHVDALSRLFITTIVNSIQLYIERASE